MTSFQPADRDPGPNTTTFILPAELFPTPFRCTCHGIASASGKLGSILAQIFLYSVDFPNEAKVAYGSVRQPLNGKSVQCADGSIVAAEGTAAVPLGCVDDSAAFGHVLVMYALPSRFPRLFMLSTFVP